MNHSHRARPLRPAGRLTADTALTTPAPGYDAGPAPLPTRRR
jgi:hypothetical protein